MVTPAVYPSTYRKRLYGGGAGLTGPDIAILGALAFLAEQAQDGGWFTVTQKEIAERSGNYIRTVRRHLPELAAAGWIEVRTTARNGHYQASSYRLALPVQGSERPTVQGSERPTVQRSERPTVQRSERPPLGVRETQRVRSYSLGRSETARPSAAASPTSYETEPETEPPAPAPAKAGTDGQTQDPTPTGPALTQLLDQLGLRRTKRANSA